MGLKPEVTDSDSKEEEEKAAAEEEEHSSCALALAKGNQDVFSKTPGGADILSEILSRLPPKEVFRIKCVSQGIYSLTKNPKFSVKYYRTCKTLSGNLTGFFYQIFSSISRGSSRRSRVNHYEQRVVDGQYFNEPVFVPVESEAGSVPDPTLNLLKPKTKRNKDNSNAAVKLLDSCNGLLLCRSYTEKKIKTCFVCNPLTKEHVALPHLGERCNSNRVWYSLLADITTEGYLEYKVVCVFKPEQGEPWTTLLIFSSETGEWEEFDEKLPPLCFKSMMGSKVFFNGSLFWDCLEGHILVCHLNKKKTESQRCYELIEAPAPRATQGRFLWIFKDKIICNCLGVFDGFPAWSLFVNDNKELEWKECQEFETLTEDISEQYAQYFNTMALWNAQAKPRIQFKIIGYKPESNMIYLSKSYSILTYDLTNRVLQILWGHDIGKFTSQCCILPYLHNIAPIQTMKTKKEEAEGECFVEEKELERNMKNIAALSLEDDIEELMSVYDNLANRRNKKKNRRQENAASH